MNFFQLRSFPYHKTTRKRLTNIFRKIECDNSYSYQLSSLSPPNRNTKHLFRVTLGQRSQSDSMTIRQELSITTYAVHHGTHHRQLRTPMQSSTHGKGHGPHTETHKSLTTSCQPLPKYRSPLKYQENGNTSR